MDQRPDIKGGVGCVGEECDQILGVGDILMKLTQQDVCQMQARHTLIQRVEVQERAQFN